jgi:hypothetical protein
VRGEDGVEVGEVDVDVKVEASGSWPVGGGAVPLPPLPPFPEVIANFPEGALGVRSASHGSRGRRGCQGAREELAINPKP